MIAFLQLAAAADTVLVRSVPPVRTAFEQVVFVASGLTSIFVFVLIAMVVVAMLVLKAKADEVGRKLDAVLHELQPAVRSANVMAEDVRLAAQNVNAMVSDSRETVQMVNTKVRHSVTELTARVDDLSALLGRVHASAERVSGVATTALAGIKVGARALGLARPAKAKARKAAGPRLRRRD